MLEMVQRDPLDAVVAGLSIIAVATIVLYALRQGVNGVALATGIGLVTFIGGAYMEGSAKITDALNQLRNRDTE